MTIQSREKFELMVVDYKNEITSILEEVKEFKKIARDEKDLDGYVKTRWKVISRSRITCKTDGRY